MDSKKFKLSTLRVDTFESDQNAIDRRIESFGLES